jgi:ATP phosphoribosyltransferase
VLARKAKLVLAFPSKGQLWETSQQFLQKCGFDIKRFGNNREYTAELSGVEGVQVSFFRPEEIPVHVQQGEAHLGITGEDLYREFSDGPPASHILIRDLGYGGARLVVAVPRSWIDVSTIGEIDEVAATFHEKHGRSIRVATKFPKQTREFFAKQGIRDYQIVNSLGATEGAPAAGLAEMIVDLTSTGGTLAQNQLKEIEGGTVCETQACLIASTQPGLWTPRTLRALVQIAEQIEAKLRSQTQVTIRFALKPNQYKKVRKMLASTGLSFPLSESDTHGENGVSGTEEIEYVAYCSYRQLYQTITLLRKQGCQRVTVQQSEFVFEGGSSSAEAFQLLLKRQALLPPSMEVLQQEEC